MLDTIYSQVAAAVLVLVCSFVFWKGDKAEQAGAAAFLIAWIGMIFAQDDTATITPKHIYLGLDLALMAVYVTIAWKSHRSWPIFAAAFQAIAVLAHLTYLLDLGVGTFAYLSAVAISGYGVQATLAVGTWNTWREREALKT